MPRARVGSILHNIFGEAEIRVCASRALRYTSTEIMYRAA